MKPFNCVEALKALGEETRIRIVHVLLKHECSVGEVAEKLGMTQYNVSKHLRILRQAGLVEMQPLAQQRLYAIAAEFKRHLDQTKGGNILDLGCCSFDFDYLPN